MAGIHNNNCDGDSCRKATGEVRVYPLGGDGNLILCRDCFAHENAYRKDRAKESGDADNWPQVDWSSAKVYSTEARTIIVNLGSKNYQAATEAFTTLMQTKVNALLAEERRHLLEGDYPYNYNEPDDEPQEDDVTTTDHNKFYSGGKLVATGVPALKAWMKKENWFPNVWFISDHGNAHLTDIDESAYRVTHPDKIPVTIWGATDEYDAKKRAAALWGFADSPDHPPFKGGFSYVLSAKGSKMTATLVEAKMTWWKVILNGKEIDKIQYTSDMDAAEVKRSLVDHDGYDSGIKVIKEAVATTKLMKKALIREPGVPVGQAEFTAPLESVHLVEEKVSKIRMHRLYESGPVLDAFTRGYCEAALWTTDEDPGSGEWSEHDDWTIDNIAADTLKEMKADCEAFQRDEAALLDQAGNDGRNGHDFWLTRNRHGAGFWDRGYKGDVGKKLSDAAHVYGEYNLYLGDDGEIHGQ